MLRGYQKKIIFLKNIGSDVFDEAYLVMNERYEKERFIKKDMITEAEKIINESLNRASGRRKISKKTLFCVGISFLIGAILGTVICLAIVIL